MDKKQDVIRTMGYLTAYLTMLYFDCERIQGGRQPIMDSSYLQEKLGSFIHQVDTIGRDKFKEGLSHIGIYDMFDTYYMTIGLGCVPGLGLNSDRFSDYLSGDITKDEFINKH